MRRPSLPILFLAILGAAPRLPAAQLRMEAATAWVENISHSSAPSDWRDAQKLELHSALSLLREWQTGFITTAELGVDGVRVPRYTLLDTTSLGLRTQARQKFGWGAFAPVLTLDAGLQARAARLAENDGSTATAGLHLAKRLSPAWRVSANGDWEQNYARRPFFDTRHHRFYGAATWYLNDRWSLTHGNGRLWGSFTANASPTVWPRALSGALGRNISDYYNTVARGVTHVFGPGWVTYLVDGRVSFWWLELSPALGRNTSLPLRYDSLFSVNQVGVKYRQDVWSVQLLHRF